jgi:hypothetical protein
MDTVDFNVLAMLVCFALVMFGLFIIVLMLAGSDEKGSYTYGLG